MRYIILILIFIALMIGNGIRNTIVKIDKAQEFKASQIDDILNW